MNKEYLCAVAPRIMRARLRAEEADRQLQEEALLSFPGLSDAQRRVVLKALGVSLGGPGGTEPFVAEDAPVMALRLTAEEEQSERSACEREILRQKHAMAQTHETLTVKLAMDEEARALAAADDQDDDDFSSDPPELDEAAEDNALAEADETSTESISGLRDSDASCKSVRFHVDTNQESRDSAAQSGEILEKPLALREKYACYAPVIDVSDARETSASAASTVAAAEAEMRQVIHDLDAWVVDAIEHPKFLADLAALRATREFHGSILPPLPPGMAEAAAAAALAANPHQRRRSIAPGSLGDPGADGFGGRRRSLVPADGLGDGGRRRSVAPMAEGIQSRRRSVAPGLGPDGATADRRASLIPGVLSESGNDGGSRRVSLISHSGAAAAAASAAAAAAASSETGGVASRRRSLLVPSSDGLPEAVHSARQRSTVQFLDGTERVSDAGTFSERPGSGATPRAEPASEFGILLEAGRPGAFEKQVLSKIDDLYEARVPAGLLATLRTQQHMTISTSRGRAGDISGNESPSTIASVASSTQIANAWALQQAIGDFAAKPRSTHARFHYGPWYVPPRLWTKYRRELADATRDELAAAPRERLIQTKLRELALLVDPSDNGDDSSAGAQTPTGSRQGDLGGRAAAASRASPAPLGAKARNAPANRRAGPRAIPNKSVARPSSDNNASRERQRHVCDYAQSLPLQLGTIYRASAGQSSSQ